MDESIIAVPLHYGTRVIGAVVISKLGVGQFDEDDVRLLEVLGGRLGRARERACTRPSASSERAKASLEISNALLDFSRRLALAESLDEVLEALSSSPRACSGQAALLGRPGRAGEDLVARALFGYGWRDAAPLAASSITDERARELLDGDEPFQLEAAKFP